MNETEILFNENDLNLQSWYKRPFGSKKSNRIIMFNLIQKCSHLSMVFGSSRTVGSCFLKSSLSKNKQIAVLFHFFYFMDVQENNFTCVIAFPYPADGIDVIYGSWDVHEMYLYHLPSELSR